MLMHYLILLIVVFTHYLHLSLYFTESIFLQEIIPVDLKCLKFKATIMNFKQNKISLDDREYFKFHLFSHNNSDFNIGFKICNLTLNCNYEPKYRL